MRTDVLIVSSDPDFQRAVDVSLNLMHHSTMLASSVADALESATKSPPGVLVADLAIHCRGDGMELASELRRRVPHLRCVLTTDGETNVHAGGAGRDDWVRTFKRPFSMIEFVGAVDEAIRHTAGQTHR